jgi:hypothetical protein
MGGLGDPDIQDIPEPSEQPFPRLNVPVRAPVWLKGGASGSGPNVGRRQVAVHARQIGKVVSRPSTQHALLDDEVSDGFHPLAAADRGEHERTLAAHLAGVAVHHLQ